MTHVFGRNEYGTACIRCGYFNYTKEASEPCSGRFDEKLIHDAETQIGQLQLKLKLVRQAQFGSETVKND